MPLKLHFRYMAPHLRVIGTILSLGFASFAVQAGMAVVNFVINHLLVQYGALSPIGADDALASIGVVQRVAMFTVLPLVGVAVAIQPLLGFNYGAKLIDRVRKTLWYGIAGATVHRRGHVAGRAPVPRRPSWARSASRTTGWWTSPCSRSRCSLLMLPLVGFQIVGANYFQATGQPAEVHRAWRSSRQILFLAAAAVRAARGACRACLPQFAGLDALYFAAPVADLLVRRRHRSAFVHRGDEAPAEGWSAGRTGRAKYQQGPVGDLPGKQGMPAAQCRGVPAASDGTGVACCVLARQVAPRPTFEVGRPVSACQHLARVVAPAVKPGKSPPDLREPAGSAILRRGRTAAASKCGMQEALLAHVPATRAACSNSSKADRKRTRGKRHGTERIPSRTRSIAFVALTIALMGVSAWVAIPFGPVMLTLQMFALMFALLALTPRECLAAIAGYLALGAVGLPMFSGMRGGIGMLLGPTGAICGGMWWPRPWRSLCGRRCAARLAAAQLARSLQEGARGPSTWLPASYSSSLRTRAAACSTPRW